MQALVTLHLLWQEDLDVSHSNEKRSNSFPDGITIQVIIRCKFDNTSNIMLKT